MNSTHIPIRTHRFAAFICSALTAGLMMAASRAQGDVCDLYPIALSAQSLSNVTEGTVLNDIMNGTEPGNFGWLSWSGDPDEPTLINSLTQPGDSFSYVNPDNQNDHTVSLGDWVSGKPGVSNGRHVRGALDALKGIEIIVPVWSETRGQGENAAYRVSGFARVRIVSYQLPSQNRITVEFLGFADCGGGISSLPAKSRSRHQLLAQSSLRAYRR